MEVGTHGKSLLPPGRTAAYFGPSAVNPGCLSLALPGRFLLWAPGQTPGSFGMQALLSSLCCCSTLQKGVSGLRLEWRTCAVCLPPATRHPQSREDQRL